MDWRRVFRGVPGVETFASVTLIQKGFADEQKYLLETAQGEKHLLRVSDILRRDEDERVYRIATSAYAAGVPTNEPIAMGLLDDGAHLYRLYRWREGTDAVAAYHTMDDIELYKFGHRAGITLKQIHHVHPQADAKMPIDWTAYYSNRFSDYVAQIDKHDIHVPGRATIEAFFQNNKPLIGQRASRLYHGDYHCHNFVLGVNRELSVLDWGASGYGDPWFDFQGLNNHEIKPAYASGLINGYFNDAVPEGFWPVLALYLTYGALSLVSWAASLRGQDVGYDPLALCWVTLPRICKHLMACGG